MKKILLSICLVLILTGSLAYGAQEIDGIIYRTEVAKVLKLGEPERLDEGFDNYSQDVKLIFTSGDLKGEKISIKNTISDNDAYNFKLKIGDKVTVTREFDQETGEENTYISEHYRVDYLIYLGLVFVGVVILIGGKKGLRAIVSLGLTILAIIYIVLPNILRGHNPIVISVLVAIGVTIVTIILITGFSKKSLAAIVGTSLGVLLAGMISFFVGSQINLTGLSAEDATMLMFIPQSIDFNFQQLLFAGIILGALGAVMDVGMSIASSIDEIYKANEDLSFIELFNGGLNVGRDVMGTMVNTLVLAYTGSSIPSLLLFMAYDSSLLEIMNLDLIATEIVRSLAGSIGLVLTIPVTALISALLLKGGEGIQKNEDGQLD